MDHCGLQVFKDAMVRLPFNEGQLLSALLCLFFATGFVTGCVFLRVAQCLGNRLTAKQELSGQNLLSWACPAALFVVIVWVGGGECWLVGRQSPPRE